MPLYYAIGLLILFFLLLIGEFFIPTAGMMGVAAAITAITAIVIAFTHSLIAGAVVTAILVISTPIILVTMVRVWPNTIIGRLILNRRPGQVAERTVRKTRSGQTLESLNGKLGVAKTDLLPAGRVEIDGQKIDVVSTGAAIDAGTAVIVVKTTAGKVRVRKALPKEIELAGATRRTPLDLDSPMETVASTDPTTESDASTSNEPESGSDSESERRESVLESLDLDSFE